MRLTYRRKWTAEEEATLCTIVDAATKFAQGCAVCPDVHAEDMEKTTGTLEGRPYTSVRCPKCSVVTMLLGGAVRWEDIAEKLVEKTGNIRTGKACSTRFAKMAKPRHAGAVGTSPRRDQLLRNIASAVLEWLQEELYEVPE